MATIGNQENKSRSALKREILDEIHDEERRRKRIGCLIGLLLKLLIIGIPLLIMAGVMAKSGLYDVPLMTKWLYKPSAPSRTIVPLVGFDSEQVMRRALARADYQPSANRFVVDLTEQELTTLVSEAVKKNAERSLLAVQTIQMTVQDQGIELFMTLPRPEREVTVKSLFSPRVEDGEMYLDIHSLEIGALGIPDFGVKLLSQALASQLAKSLSMEGSGIGELRDVSTTDKRLYLEFTPSLKLPF